MEEKKVYDYTKEKNNAEELENAAADNAEGDQPEGVNEAQDGEADGEPAVYKLGELEEKVAELEDKLLRKQAEFQNFRKRTASEMAGVGEVTKRELLSDLLPVVDMFERAIPTEPEDEFTKGMAMVYKQLMEVLAKNGLEKIEAVGKEFDPNLHQAVQRIESEELADNTVALELQVGYKVGEKVIRPSMVQVVGS